MNDAIQRQQALDLGRSFIVQAPAGSGKTELLTQRYLKLLSVCDYPENVMAMTFTNKAVDELTQRVLSALKSTQQSRPVQPHKQITYDLSCQVIARANAKNWQLLDNPKRLKISTIDGLSSLINSRYPSRQLLPRKIMAQPWEQQRAYRHAAEQTLLMINDQVHGQAIATLLLYLDNHVEKFYRLLIPMLGKRDQWLTRLYRQDALDTEVLKNSAEKIITKHLQALVVIAQPLLNKAFFALMSASADATFAQVDALPTAQITDLEKWQSVQSLCLTKSGQWRKKLTKNNGFPSELKAQKTQLLEQLHSLSAQEPLRLALQQLTQLPDVDFSNAQTAILSNIASVLKLCVAQLQLYFECEQAHDFIEVALLANQALDEQSGVSDVALFLDYQIQHLLIDEFQDTSALQFNTLEKLIKPWQENDGKTLFLVGDPMQSIYRFRESEVGLFLQVKAHGIANIKLISLILETNFRSSQSLVEANNRFFQCIFPKHEDSYQGAIPYSASHANSTTLNAQATVFYAFADNQFAQQAQTVLEIVVQSLSEQPTNEVAILVRSRAHLQDIVPLLKRHKIAFESLKTTPLKDHLLTRDLFSLTKALLNLGDKLAWLSVLRAPWCGLILDDLLAFSATDDVVIYEQLAEQSIREKLTQDGQKRAQHLHQGLADVLSNQGRFSFVERLTYALDQLGVSISLSPSEQRIKTQFLHIINDCEQRQLLNAQTIIAMLDNLYVPSTNAQVKLMTIHQAKGLEFDTVIIPNLGKGPRYGDAPIIRLKMFADQSLLLAPIKSTQASAQSQTYEYLKFIEAEQNKFEAMRLLYVAMTRSKQNLHLLGELGRAGRVTANSLLEFLMPFYQQDFKLLQTPVAPDLPEPTAPTLQRFKHLNPIVSKDTTKNEVIAQQPSFERLFKSLLGTLVHQYFEQELFQPSIENLNARLIEIGIAPSEIDQSRNFILTLLNNTKQDAQFDWLFKNRPSTLTEAAFISGNETLIIDRLFIEDGVLWLIDFKTAKPNPDESIKQFISRQQLQHTKQLRLYQAALSQIYVNTIKCVLYCPAISQLIEI